METLNVTRININAPYKVWNEGSIYRFETDNGIKYLVDFELDSNPFYTAYWFNLTNPEHTKSPGDIKIAKTVVCIIEEFFRLNPEVLLYMCSTDNGQQAQRSRLFLRWFNGYEQQKRYVIKSTEVKGVDPEAFVVMLEHEPWAWRHHILPERKVPLTLSGHTHGGQITFFGFSPMGVFQKEWCGEYREGNSILYVTKGLGGVIPLRFEATGEIVVITLHSKKK